MALMFEKKLERSNLECEASHEDVEDWIYADNGIAQSRTLADAALKPPYLHLSVFSPRLTMYLADHIFF